MMGKGLELSFGDVKEWSQKAEGHGDPGASFWVASYPLLCQLILGEHL